MAKPSENLFDIGSKCDPLNALYSHFCVVLSGDSTNSDVYIGRLSDRNMETRNEYERTASQSTVGYSPLPPQAQEVLAKRQHPYQQPSTCCNRDMRNQPQANALGAAALIFLSGGMNIAWSIGFICLDKELEISTHMRIAWFIAAIIGSLGSVLLGKRFGYKLLMQFCSMFVLLGGVLFATTQLQPQAMLVARYLNGLANGLALPCSLAMAGELAVCYKRGTISSVTEQMSCTLGIFIQIVLSVSWSEEYDINVDHLHGILCCIYGGLALCLATVYSIESPVDLLAQGDQESAIAALIRLQYPQQVTTETDEQLTEHTAYLSHNRSLSSTQAWCQALPALLRLCLLRMLYAMSTSILVVYTLTLTSSSVYGYSSGPFVLFGLLRLAGSCGGAFVQDTLGRKLTQLPGFMVCSVGSIGLARRLTAVEIVRYDDYRMALWLLLMFQLFAGFGFAPSSVYLTEAFPRSVKRMCIAIAYILELAVQLATFMLHMNLDNTCIYFYGLGIFQLIGFLFSHWYLPETKFMTLRQAQQKFRDFS